MSKNEFNYKSYGGLELIKSGVIHTTPLTIANPGAGNYAIDVQNDSVNHNLGYVPIVIAYILNISDVYEIMPYQEYSGTNLAPAWTFIGAWADSTVINVATRVITLGASFTGGSDTIKYFLLRNKGQN